MAVLMALFLPLVLWIIHVAGPALIPSLIGFSVFMILLVNLMVPVLILPLFYTFTDLEDGELKTAIFAEAKKTGIPVSQIKVIDGSKRSSHSNAFVTGFGSFRKVVLFDTLIKSHSQDEILAIVNHELGHVAHLHLVKHALLSIAHLTVMFTLFSFCLNNKDMLLSFGITHSSVFMYLLIFSALYGSVSFPLEFLNMYVIRRAEYEADAYVVRYNHAKGLKSGLIILFKHNKGQLIVDNVYSALNNSHPTLIERLQAIDSLVKNK
jgi:STE24 endopeptidase